MANKPIKSIKYPGLPDTYTFVQIGTEAGQAADAKAVGDEIAEIENALKSNASIGAITSGYYINGSGKVLADENYACCDYVEIDLFTRVLFSVSFLTARGLAFYDSEKFCLFAVNGNNCSEYGYDAKSEPQTVAFNVPIGAKYLRFTRRTAYGISADDFAVIGYNYGGLVKDVKDVKILSSNVKENTDKIHKLETVSFNKTIQFFLTDILRELAWTITNGDGLIESFEQIMGRKSIVVGEPYDYALVSDEYVTKTGIIEGYALWSRTNAIPCDSVDFLVFTGNGTVFTTAGYSVFYDKDMNFISNFTVTLNNDTTSVTIPVPKNANTFIISAVTPQFAYLVSIVPTRGE